MLCRNSTLIAYYTVKIATRPHFTAVNFINSKEVVILLTSIFRQHLPQLGDGEGGTNHFTISPVFALIFNVVLICAPECGIPVAKTLLLHPKLFEPLV